MLSLERLNRILEIDERSLVAVVQPHVVTGALQAEVEARGLFYPPDPASLDRSVIGGNVAEGAGGPRAFKYGDDASATCSGSRPSCRPARSSAPARAR